MIGISKYAYDEKYDALKRILILSSLNREFQRWLLVAEVGVLPGRAGTPRLFRHSRSAELILT